MNFYSNISLVVRQVFAKAIIILLALVVATILIAPSVNLDPAVPRLEWAACLLVIFISWLAVLFAWAALLRTGAPLPSADCILWYGWERGAPLSCDCLSTSCLRC